MKKIIPLLLAFILAVSVMLVSCADTDTGSNVTTADKTTTAAKDEGKETDETKDEETSGKETEPSKDKETEKDKGDKENGKDDTTDADGKETEKDKETSSDDTTVNTGDSGDSGNSDTESVVDTGSSGGGGLDIDGIFVGGNNGGDENDVTGTENVPSDGTDPVETDKDNDTEKAEDTTGNTADKEPVTEHKDPEVTTGSSSSDKPSDKETQKPENKPDTDSKDTDEEKPDDTEEVIPSGDVPVPQASSTKDAFPKYILTKSGKKLIHTYSDRAVGVEEDNSETYPFMPMLSTTTFPDPTASYNTPAAMIRDIRPGLVWKHVMVGYDGYMFYEDTKEDFDGSSVLNGSIYKRAKEMLESSQAWAESHDMKFYIVIAPNKNTVYPDYMPEGYKMASYRRYDQFVDLINDSGITAVDLRDAMSQSVQANPQMNLYYKYDTHWNNHAGYIAYETTMNMIRKDFPKAVLHKRSEYQINYAETYMKDQAYYLGQYSYYKDYGPVYTLKSDKTASLVNFEPRQGWGQFAFAYDCKTGKDKGFSDKLYWLQYRNAHNADAPNAYILRDSYSIAMIPFFKDSFNVSTYNWTFSLNSCKREILEYDTDVIIAIIAERNLKNYVNQKEVTD